MAGQVPASFQFAKAGPSGCVTPQSQTETWQRLRDTLPAPVQLVAVAYADHQAAQCQTPEQVFQQAADAGIEYALLDTFVKDGRSSHQHLGTAALTKLGQLAQHLNLWWTLAGSITWQDVASLHQQHIHPNCFGVRGDVCPGGRTEPLCIQRIDQWQHALKATRHSTARDRVSR